MSANRQEVVDVIKGWKRMKESDGSYKPIVDIYNSILPHPCDYRLKYTDDWGPGMISAVYHQVEMSEFFPCESNYARMVAKAKEMDVWEEFDRYWPKIADVCVLGPESEGPIDTAAPDAAGIVIDTDEASHTFVVMIGNIDHAIETRTLSIGSKYIQGFITIYFDEDSVKAKAQPRTMSISAEEAEDGIYTVPVKKPQVVGTGTLSKIAAGTAVQLKDDPIFASPKTMSSSGTKTGKYFIWSVDTVNGRVRITNAKNNVGVKGQVTGWIDVSVALATIKDKPQRAANASIPEYQVNAVYVVQKDGLQVKKGPGTNYDDATYKDLTPNARKYDKQKKGCLAAGAKVTCLDVSVTGVNVWIKIPSGWIPAYYNKRFNVK